MTEEQINKRLKELDAMTGPKPGRPKIPVRDYLQEAENINTWCRQDKAALIKAGLNWELAEDLPVRIGALKVSEAEWNTDFKQYMDIQSKWGVTVRKAFIFRDNLIHHFFFAFHKNAKAYAIVRDIDKGNTNADMIQNLMDLAVLGQKHKKELEDTGFDFSLLEEAEIKSKELGKQLSAVNIAIQTTDPKLLLRNKAHKHLKEAVDEIRRIGKFLFKFKDKNREGYISPYVRKVNTAHKMKKKKKKEEGNDQN